MKIEGKHLIGVEPGVLWPLLKDPNVLRRVFPGSEDIVATGENEYRVRIRQRLGQYDDLFTGTLHLSEKDPDVCLRGVANLECQDGMARMTADIQLEEADDASTLLRYVGEVELGGRLQAVPLRLVETTANAFVRRALEALERETASPQPYVLRRATATPVTVRSSHTPRIALPGWLAPLAIALVGLALFRYFDNRRIPAQSGNETTTRTEAA